ncbi:hypothetical protein AAFC00_001543 [Neodothiora populina]|uniref:cyclin-dependent kinase n=1 Tax=Neodothiora populina TaxID=2781224 RepID=A0ABR3PP97_9PEZI
MVASRWANDEEDALIDAQRKKEKEEKKRAKAEKARKHEHEAAAAAAAAEAAKAQQQEQQDDRPAKRRRLSEDDTTPATRTLLRFQTPSWTPARSIDEFERLNHIEEGSYGFVSRAKDSTTGQVVAIKKLKMDVSAARYGFPITALREIQTLNAARGHRHIVELREVVVGQNLVGEKGEVFLVMDFLEHDLKTLMEEMEEPFLPSEVKTLMLQLGSAIEFLHDRWILHRDLKTSNILMNNRGEIKLADFGMARFIGSPPPANLTALVVTLWYRSPELLLGAPIYDNGVDMWSLGCIFGELLTNTPLLQGKNEVEQLSKIFDLCGIPTEQTWPGFRRLPNAKSLRLPMNPGPQNPTAKIRAKFPFLTASGTSLLSALLSLDPANRPSAKEVLEHGYFKEDPRPKSTAMFPTFPSKAGQERRRRVRTPNAPTRNGEAGADVDFSGLFAGRADEEQGAGFSLKMG